MTIKTDVISDDIKPDTGNSADFENGYDSVFLRFVGEGFFMRIDADFYSCIDDCGFIDSIDSEVYRYNAGKRDYVLVRNDIGYVSWLVDNIGKQDVSGSNRIIKFERDGLNGYAFPIKRLDTGKINSLRLSAKDKNVIADDQYYYCAGFLYFMIKEGGTKSISEEEFVSSILRSLVRLFENIIFDQYRLECQTRESNDYELLLSVAGSIISTLDLNEVLQGIVNAATESLRSERGSLMLIDESTGELVLRYGKGLKPGLINNVRVKPGEGIAGSVAKTGQPLLITDIESSDRFKKKSGKEFNTKSLLSVPMKIKERVIGVFNINNKCSGEVYDDFDLKLLQALSSQASIAIQNAKHYQEALQAQAELEEQIEASSNLYEEVHTLYEIVRATTMVNDPTMDPRERILELATKNLNATVGFLFLPQENNVIKSLASSRGDINAGFQFSKISFSDENIITKVIKGTQSVLITSTEGQTVSIEPMTLTPKEFREDQIVSEIGNFTGETVKSMLIVPLFDEKSVSIGVCLIVNKLSSDGNFSEHDRNLLQILGQQISAIIRDRNLQKQYIVKQKMEQELDVAHGIQQKLIPKHPPVVEGIDISAVNMPAKTVSGDYYDFLTHDSAGKKLGFVIADVSGKGVPAALIMSMTRAILKTQVVENYSPADILFKTNNFIISDMEANRYVTMFYGMIDIDSLEFTFSKAGHNPPIWMHGDTLEVEYLESTGFFVGMFESARYEEKKIRLAPSDKLILFTDGVIEAMNRSDEEYGLDRFVRILKKYNDFDARSIIDKVLIDVENFVDGAPQSDDITLLIINVGNFRYEHVEICSTIDECVKVTEMFGDLIKDNLLPDFGHCEIMMIIDEMIMNAIEHGNKRDPEKKVFISYIINSYKVEIIIRDEGEGFNVGEVMATRDKVSLYDKRGRGIIIARSLVDRIEYNKLGNEVRLVKYFR